MHSRARLTPQCTARNFHGDLVRARRATESRGLNIRGGRDAQTWHSALRSIVSARFGVIPDTMTAFDPEAVLAYGALSLMLDSLVRWFAAAILFSATNALAVGDPARGALAFRQCTACHSTAPGVQLTGPSLAHVWGRKAGTEEGFQRYSDALKSSGITWNAQTLDKWLTDPATFVPGNAMPFAGIRSSPARQDIIAYLKAVSEGKAPPSQGQGGGMMGGGMRGGGMMGGGPGRLNLKNAPPAGQVTSLEHCRDTYTVKTTDGQTNKVWEFNLRLKTDSSPDGPLPGKPVIVGAGMHGDRASVVFASPAEISTYIKESCK